MGKNYTRIDKELRAHGLDYHKRQPYAVLVAILFLSWETCDDGKPSGKTPSSFGSAVRSFRPRTGLDDTRDNPERFEGFFIGLYDPACEEAVRFFDVSEGPPRTGRPVDGDTLSFDEMIDAIVQLHGQRNDPPFVRKEETDSEAAS